MLNHEFFKPGGVQRLANGLKFNSLFIAHLDLRTAGEVDTEFKLLNKQ